MKKLFIFCLFSFPLLAMDKPSQQMSPEEIQKAWDASRAKATRGLQELIDNQNLLNGDPLSYFNLMQGFADVGADVNIRNNQRFTPLMIAVGHGKVELVRMLLIDKRANLNIQNNSGQTALDIARARGDQEIIDLLSEFQKKKIE